MSWQDEAAIKSRMYLYGFAVDSLRWDLFNEIFVQDDLYVRHGDRDPWTDLAKFKEDFATYHKVFTATQHSMTNMICQIDGDRASTVTYGNWRLVRLGAEGGDTWLGQGWYEDQLVRTAQGWRIRRRQSRQVWREGNDNLGSNTGVKWVHRVASLQDSELGQAIVPQKG